MDSGAINWSILKFVGPLLMVIVFAWAALRNRKSKKNMDLTERGTRENYKREDAAHRNDNDFGT